MPSTPDNERKQATQGGKAPATHDGNTGGEAGAQRQQGDVDLDETTASSALEQDDQFDAAAPRAGSRHDSPRR